MHETNASMTVRTLAACLWLLHGATASVAEAKTCASDGRWDTLKAKLRGGPMSLRYGLNVSCFIEEWNVCPAVTSMK